jgi:AraC-like DNA-binding protein
MGQEFFIKDNKVPEYFFVSPVETLKEANLILPTHSYRSRTFEMLIVTEGFLVRECNSRSIRVNANEFHARLAGQSTSLQSLSDNVKGYYCNFNHQFLKEFQVNGHLEQELAFVCSFIHRYPLRLNAAVSGQIKQCFGRILELYHEEKVDFTLIQAYLSVMVCEIEKVLNEDVADLNPSSSFRIAGQYNDLLVKHIAEHQELDFYASSLNISPNHLNKSIKTVTGKSAHTMLNEFRIQEAKVQLKHTDIPIGDIAFNLGFNDSSYFSKCFRKATDISPAEYRNLWTKPILI